MAPPNSGVYFIQNYGTKTVVDLGNGSSADGTQVQGFKQRDLSDVWVPAQLWVLYQVPGTNVYTIQNTNSRTYLTLGNAANGSPVLGYGGNSSDDQKWVFTVGGHPGTFVITNKAAGTCADLTNGNVADGTVIQGWSGPPLGNVNNNQLWHFIPV